MDKEAIVVGPMIGAGICAAAGIIGGGIYGAFKGRDIARKRRENERRLIEKALKMK